MREFRLLAMCMVIPVFQVLALASIGGSHLQPQASSAGKYDPTRDPEKDIQAAIAEATRTGKRILLEVGGEWCGWCHTLDRFFDESPKLLELREKSFVTIKINFSRENENKNLLSRYPDIEGYPHLFVLDTSGKFLHSQDTGQLESGRSYDLEKFFAFLKKWARS